MLNKIILCWCGHMMDPINPWIHTHICMYVRILQKCHSLILSSLGVVVEFTNIIFSLSENDSIPVCVRLSEGQLERNITVLLQLSSNGSSTEGMYEVKYLAS